MPKKKIKVRVKARKVTLPCHPDFINVSNLPDGRFASPNLFDQVEALLKSYNGLDETRLWSNDSLETIASWNNIDLEVPFSVMVVKSREGFELFAVFPVPLGTGATGSTYLLQDKEGQLHAQKDVYFLSERFKAEYQQEVAVLRTIGMDCETYTSQKEYGRGEVSVGTLIRSFASGIELGSIKELNLNTTQYLEVFNNIATKLDLLHKAGILHLDIRPQNILVNPYTLDVTIIDFGSSLQHSNGHASGMLRGTTGFLAPEHQRVFDDHMKFMKQDKPHGVSPAEQPVDYTTGSDVASLGRVFDLFSEAVPEIKPLTKKMMQHDQSNRPALSEVHADLERMASSKRKPEAVAIIDIDAFQALDKREKKSLYKNLMQFSTIQLISKADTGVMGAALIVRDEIFKGMVECNHPLKINETVIHGKKLDLTKDVTGTLLLGTHSSKDDVAHKMRAMEQEARDNARGQEGFSGDTKKADDETTRVDFKI